MSLVVVRPCVCVEVRAASCVEVKLSKVEGGSAPICVPDRTAICVAANAPACAAVRAPSAVAPRPAICAVERLTTLSAFSEVVEIALIWVVVSPCVWVAVREVSCVEDSLSKVAAANLPICVAVTAPS